MRWGMLALLLLLCSGAHADMGRLAYVAAGALWVKTLPDGAPKAVAHGQVLFPRWSASGTWLCYWDGKAATLHLLRADGAAAQTPAVQYGAQWSPVADMLAFSKSAGGLFLWNAATGKTRMLLPARPDTHVENIAWRDDGRVLAYLIEPIIRQPQSHDRLWRINSDGSGRRLLLDAGKDGYRPLPAGWTPDGKMLLVFRDEDRSASIMADGVPLLAVPADGGRPRKLTDFAFDDAFFWSPAPKEHSIALISGAGRQTWHGKWLEIARNARPGRRFSPAGIVINAVAWSPDGRTLACSVMPEAPANLSTAEQNKALAQSRIKLTPSTAWRPHALRDGSPYCEQDPQWSRDGEHLLIERIDPRTTATSLWLIAADGSTAQQVASLDENLVYISEPELYAWWQRPVGQ